MEFGLRYKVMVGAVVGVFFIVSLTLLFKYESTSDQAGTERFTTAKTVIPQAKGEVQFAERIKLPVSGSAPEQDVKHTISIEDIRRGCAVRDCIPAVDRPEFMLATEMSSILQDDSIGIALAYQGEHRFYPFPMLETHELVNDTVAGDPLLITYCPLCGTGIVFERTLDGEPVEFGVSGMLWQSNLLMYNRASTIDERNLWSQVLGEAVVGSRAGEALVVVPSDIMRFGDWAAVYPEGLVLTTGSPKDPYGGEYYRVASSFGPDFDAAMSSLEPDAYVYGVIVSGQPLAIPRATLPEGVTRYEIADTAIKITRTATGVVEVTDTEGLLIPDIEGFWFSWAAAHPDTMVWSNES